MQLIPAAFDGTMNAMRSEQPKEVVSTSTTKRQVRFNSDCAVFLVRHTKDYTEDEIRSTWYDRDDLDEVKSEVAMTVAQIMDHQPLDPDMQCSRGLEYRTPEGLHERQVHKLSALDAVLNEQGEQWDADVYDEEMLASVYRKISASCQWQAHQRALRDERFVRRLNAECKKTHEVAQLVAKSHIVTRANRGPRRRMKAHSTGMPLEQDAGIFHRSN